MRSMRKWKQTEWQKIMRNNQKKSKCWKLHHNENLLLLHRTKIGKSCSFSGPGSLLQIWRRSWRSNLRERWTWGWSHCAWSQRRQAGLLVQRRSPVWHCHLLLVKNCQAGLIQCWSVMECKRCVWEKEELLWGFVNDCSMWLLEWTRNSSAELLITAKYAFNNVAFCFLL